MLPSFLPARRGNSAAAQSQRLSSSSPRLLFLLSSKKDPVQLLLLTGEPSDLPGPPISGTIRIPYPPMRPFHGGASSPACSSSSRSPWPRRRASCRWSTFTHPSTSPTSTSSTPTASSSSPATPTSPLPSTTPAPPPAPATPSPASSAPSITDKADVYSFGMVLLEIVRGRKNSKDDDPLPTCSSSSSSDGGAAVRDKRSSYFPALALELHEQGRYEELLDPRLEGRAHADEVALCCLHEDAALRPNMTAVAAMLDGSMDIAEPRTELLRYLKMYGRGLVDLRPVGGWMDGGKKGSDTTTAGASSSWSPPSCVSAQQLSGPR